MKGRGGNGAGPTDFLVCFPSRAHLALMPKPICSPSRPSMAEPGKRHLRHPARPTITAAAAAAAAARGHQSPSPLFAASAKHGCTPGVDDEPTSPKVTCAGQIKVGRPKPTPKPRPTRTWLSVVEEIERLRADRTATRRKKKSTWLEAIGLKKDAWQFLGALRGVHFNFGCFGSFRGATECSTDDDDEDDGDDEADDDDDDNDDDDDAVEEEKHGGGDGDGDGESRSETRTIFSKWFMVLEQNQVLGFKKEEKEELKVDEEDEKEEEEEEEDGREPPSAAAPPNALLLMRCRSAPAKGLLSRRQRKETGDAEAEKAAEEEDEDEDEDEEVSATKMIKENEKEKERLVLMSYAPDFFKVSMDIAKETWVVGSADPFARSRSCKR